MSYASPCAALGSRVFSISIDQSVQETRGIDIHSISFGLFKILPRLSSILVKVPTTIKRHGRRRVDKNDEPHYLTRRGRTTTNHNPSPPTMNFAKSSQRKSWIFSQESIDACRERAVAGSQASSPSSGPLPRLQKFASGFHNRPSETPRVGSCPATTETRRLLLSVRNQETLVQFHAHQIQTLVGPYALLPELRRSQKVLSTAIILFRRFFLSNSVVEFNPRKIATAAAFFAAKLEEEKIEVSRSYS